jgi:hypothetical protein
MPTSPRNRRVVKKKLSEDEEEEEARRKEEKMEKEKEREMEKEKEMERQEAEDATRPLHARLPQDECGGPRNLSARYKHYEMDIEARIRDFQTEEDYLEQVLARKTSSPRVGDARLARLAAHVGHCLDKIHNVFAHTLDDYNRLAMELEEGRSRQSRDITAENEAINRSVTALESENASLRSELQLMQMQLSRKAGNGNGNGIDRMNTFSSGSFASDEGGGGGRGQFGVPVPPPAVRRRSILPTGLSPDELALQVGIIVSMQQELYSHNMFDTFNDKDEVHIQKYVMEGFRREDAVLFLFEDRVGRVRISGPNDSPQPDANSRPKQLMRAQSMQVQ